MTPTVSATPASNFDTFVEAIHISLSTILPNSPLFRTGAVGLYDVYLESLSGEIRQHHNCHACRDFINRYGGLVVIAPDGSLLPAFWCGAADLVAEEYRGSMRALYEAIRRDRIVSPFISGDEVWGKPTTGEWTHFFARNPGSWRAGVLTPGQRMAELQESYRTIQLALDEVEGKVLSEAIALFEQDALAWSDKFVAPAKWLLEQGETRRKPNGRNLLWKAVATAPTGFLHPRASVLWPLLEGIKAGLSYETIKRRFGAMTSPLQYQRPQAAPSAGVVKQAEEAFAKTGLAPALERRFATIVDLEKHELIVWKPEERAPLAAGGVFGHLKTKGLVELAQVSVPERTMTWLKFTTEILPQAQKIQQKVPVIGNFIGLTAAVHEDAPPILKWDLGEEDHNHLCWYVYAGASSAQQWNLQGPSLVTVNAIAQLPSMRRTPHIGTGHVLVLEGCEDMRHSGNSLFPVTLVDYLYGFRSVIEAYSRSATLVRGLLAPACGYDLRKERCACRLRVTIDDRWQDISIDRWD